MFLIQLFSFPSAKISYHSRPPMSQNLSSHLTKEMVAEMQKGFSSEELEKDNMSTINGEILL